MRLFFKHFFRSILRRPLQPFILIFTLMLSVAVSVMALTIDDAFADETKAKQAAQYGTADITVTLNGTASSRFMFAQDAQKLLGDRAKVAGCYELPLFFGEKNETVPFLNPIYQIQLLYRKRLRKEKGCLWGMISKSESLARKETTR